VIRDIIRSVLLIFTIYALVFVVHLEGAQIGLRIGGGVGAALFVLLGRR